MIAGYSNIANLQGEVLAIVDGHGATLVEYEYDPYGRLRSMSGVMSTTLGEANLFVKPLLLP